MMNRPCETIPLILAMSLALAVGGEPGKAGNGMVLHVAPNGNDANTGSRENPLKTLEAARDKVRAARPNPTAATQATVYLHPGTYRRTQTFEIGPRDSYASYKAYPSSGSQTLPKPRLIGGVEIPGREVRPVVDEAVLDRVIEKEARPHLRQINLKSLGITDYGELGPRGFRRAYIPAPLELFIDGKPMRVARWPNAGEKHIPMGRVHDAGSTPRTGDYSFRPGTFEYGVERANLWTQARDFYVSGIFCWGFADDTIKVAKLDAEKGTFTLAHPHLYGLKNQSFTKWYALNLLEEIDCPGEYFVDRQAGILYFYPPAGFSDASRIEVSLLDTVMVAIEDAIDVCFEGLTFEVARSSGVYIEGGKRNMLRGCTLRNLGELGVQIGQGTKPFPFGKHDGCGNKEDGQSAEAASRIMGSWHEWIYKETAWNRRSGEGHRIQSCDIHDCGAGGVSLSGGDRKTLTPGDNAVINCDIYRVNRWDRTYKALVNIEGVGNRVANCHLHSSYGQAVYLHGNNHIIEYNEIDRVLTDISDMGAIYMGRDPSETGNVFRYNFFHHIRNFHKGGWGVQALFFDDHSGPGNEIEGNIFYKAGSRATINFNGGGGVEIRNNIFVDCPRPVLGDNGVGGVRKFMHSELGAERVRQQVDITGETYASAYPQLLAIYNGGNPAIPKFKDHNYVVKGDYSAFKDVSSGDFSLVNAAAITDKIPGFEPPPFEKIGLFKDACRTHVFQPGSVQEALPNPPAKKAAEDK